MYEFDNRSISIQTAQYLSTLRLDTAFHCLEALHVLTHKNQCLGADCVSVHKGTH